MHTAEHTIKFLTIVLIIVCVHTMPLVRVGLSLWDLYTIDGLMALSLVVGDGHHVVAWDKLPL